MKDESFTQVLDYLEEFRKKDFTFSSGHILGSMCTQPHPIAIDAYMKFLDTNLGDPELCPGTKEIEGKLFTFYSKLLNAPKNVTYTIGSGGTESNINAIWLAKKLNSKDEIIVPDSAHFSFEKIASLMDIKILNTKLKKDYTVDLKELKKNITNKTSAIVAIAGTTELGTIDPIPEISDLCYDEKIFLHIDAAFGGYVIPFLKELKYDVPDFDFKCKGVSTLSIDAHKMGISAIPLGALLIRDKNWLEEISVNTPYISGKRQAGLLATRSGAPVAAAYAVAKYLGMKGYREIVRSCLNNTIYAKEKIEKMGLNLVSEPVMNVLGIRLKKPEKISKKLAKRGWKVNKMDRLSAIRIVIMPHVKKETIDEFLPILKKVSKEVGEI